MQTVKISDANPAGLLSFDLADVLDAISDVAQTYRWSILWLEGVGDNIVDLEVQVRQSESGIAYDWSALVAISTMLRQTYDGLFVGTDGAAPLPRLHDGLLLCYAPPSIVIEAVDSSYWLVSAQEPIILDHLRDRFRSVQVVDPSDDWH